MVIKNGKEPANARCLIDYSKGKPKIKFSYPNDGRNPNKQALSQNIWGFHSIILFCILVVLIYYPTYVSIHTVDYPKECSVVERSVESNYTIINNIDGFNHSNYYKYIYGYNYKYIYGYNITCDNKTYKIKFNTNTLIGTEYIGFVNDDLHLYYICLYFGYVMLLIFLFFIINYLLTKFLIKNKWYQKWFPKFNAKITSRRYIKFTTKDVDNNMVEIPSFNNVVLDYKTNGDFSKQLERIKIHEHSWNKYRKGKVGKKRVSTNKWYARFYFKDKPKNGYLEVIFQ